MLTLISSPPLTLMIFFPPLTEMILCSFQTKMSYFPNLTQMTGCHFAMHLTLKGLASYSEIDLTSSLIVSMFLVRFFSLKIPSILSFLFII